jgi:hypothetical protein
MMTAESEKTMKRTGQIEQYVNKLTQYQSQPLGALFFQHGTDHA